ncbi:MAG: SWIM zinc finger family protein [Chlamydiia bacterium]
MKINHRVLHIPPYISCRWSEIASIGVETKGGENLLQVQLLSGSRVLVPNLNQDEIDLIFKMHVHHLEHASEEEDRFKNLKELPFFSNLFQPPPMDGNVATSFGAPISFHFDANDPSALFQGHNPAFANSPPLPKEILDKITLIAKAIGGEMVKEVEPIDNCNCFFCQIARSLHNEKTHEKKPRVPRDLSKDLLHGGIDPEWMVEEVGPHMFKVTSRDEPGAIYQVYLGDSISCSCGSNRCQHIVAALKT